MASQARHKLDAPICEIATRTVVPDRGGEGNVAALQMSAFDLNHTKELLTGMAKEADDLGKPWAVPSLMRWRAGWRRSISRWRTTN